MLGELLDKFKPKAISSQNRKIEKLRQTWRELLPAELVSHSYPQNLRRGTLRVMVDDAGAMCELNWVIQEGLLEQLRQCCPGISLSEIKTVRGRGQGPGQDEK